MDCDQRERASSTKDDIHFVTRPDVITTEVKADLAETEPSRAMHITARDIVGIGVFEAQMGAKVGSVEALLIDADDIAVKAIGVAGAGRWGQSRYVELCDIVFASRGIIVVRSEDVFRDRKMYVKGHLLDYLLDKCVRTEDGRSLGRSQDYTFDTGSGEIQNLTTAPVQESLGGLMESVDASRSRVIPRRHIKSIGDDITVDSTAVG